jgi:hypothetical protein
VRTITSDAIWISQSRQTQNRPKNRPTKGDIDSPWSHDLFEDNNRTGLSLSERLNGDSTSAPRPNLNSPIAQKALREATGLSDGQLSIKGASTPNQGNVVEVAGLVRGTTAEDVSAIFKRCGAIANTKAVSSAPPYQDSVTIRVTFKASASAAVAVQKFHNQTADGKTLSVKIVGGSNVDGLGRVRQEGTVDVLMNGNGESGSWVWTILNFFIFLFTRNAEKCGQTRWYMLTPVLMFSWPHLAPTQRNMRQHHELGSEVVDEAEVGSVVGEVVVLRGWTWIRSDAVKGYRVAYVYAVYTVSLPTHIFIFYATPKNVRASLMPPRTTPPPPKGSFYPANDASTHRDILYFEERLKMTVDTLQRRKFRYKGAHNIQPFASPPSS